MKYRIFSIYLLIAALSIVVLPVHAADLSEGLTITDTFVQSPFDKVPRFCNAPNVPAEEIITSTKEGNWSDASTWSTGEVPGTDAKVQITPNTTVTYDVNSDTDIECIEVQGTLQFSASTTTKLRIRELMVMPTGTLIMGTEDTPIPEANPATIIFRDVPLRSGTPGSQGIDPQMYGNGLIVFGTVTMHGTEKSPTFVRLAQEPTEGATSLELYETPSGWQVGDDIFIPDTRGVLIGNDPADALDNPKDFSQRERLTIAAISGKTITLSSPVSFTHACDLDASNEFAVTTLDSGEPLCPHVGNLSRSITFQSENPDGTRGHGLFLHRADIDVRYARFKDMGRTLAIKLDNSTFGSGGELTKVGTNQIGRYSFHMHHVWGPRNADNAGYQGTVIGNALDGGLKWIMTIHDTHFFHIAENVLYDGVGAGIALEDGSETQNLLEHNLSSTFSGGTPTAGVRAGAEGVDGDPFWMAGTRNMFVNNVAADGKSNGFGHWTHGVVINLNVPLIRGADNRNYTKNPEADRRKTNEGFIQFIGNEIYSVKKGLELNGAARSVMEDTRIWHITDRGFQLYDGTYDKFWLNKALVHGVANDFVYHQVGIFDNTVLKSYYYDLDIQHVTGGYRIEKGHSYMEKIKMYAYRQGFLDIVKATHNQIVKVKDYTFEQLPTRNPFAKPTYNYSYSGPPAKHTVVKQILIDNYNGDGKSIQVFKTEQAPSYAPPAGSTTAICNDDVSLTNQQCWDGFQTAIGAELATCADSTTYGTIEGFSCDREEPITPDSPMLEFRRIGNLAKTIPSTRTDMYYRTFSVPSHNVSSVKWQLDGGVVQTDSDISGHIPLENLAPGNHTLDIYLADIVGQEIADTRQSMSFSTSLPVYNAPPTITVEKPSFVATVGNLLNFTVIAEDVDSSTLTLEALDISSLFPGATFE